MRLLKLSCASCTAPLEVGEDLGYFSCDYCGTAQIIERSGVAIPAPKAETDLKAVQRATARTAAELAIPRLTKELTEAELARAGILLAAKAKLESAKRARRKYAQITFGVTFLLGLLTIPDIDGVMGTVLAYAWLAALIAAPIWVYKRARLPMDNGREATAAIDARITQIEEHLRINRSLLDTLPV